MVELCPLTANFKEDIREAGIINTFADSQLVII